jgi:ATP-dependent Clp endopeptidase proteolytic subunit ClpP
VLAAGTALTAVQAEILVGAMEPALERFGSTELFAGVIVIALIGNAAEHYSAVTAARRDEMTLAVEIAVGSSAQIALLVAPALVLYSFAIGHPMSLLFNGLEITAIALSVLATSIVVIDGESNWVEGLQLLSVYLILVLAFYFVPDPAEVLGNAIICRMGDLSDRLIVELIDAVRGQLRKESGDRLRDVYLIGDIEKDTARICIERPRELANDNNRPITLFINSAGGNVTDGLAIHDAVRHIISRGIEITIIVQGMAYSMGSVVLQAASEGRRLAFPHSWIMIHEPAKWAGWQSTSAAAQHLERLKQMQDQIYKILSFRSGKPLRQIIRDTKRTDFYLDAQNALDYGLIDAVWPASCPSRSRCRCDARTRAAARRRLAPLPEVEAARERSNGDGRHAGGRRASRRRPRRRCARRAGRTS